MAAGKSHWQMLCHWQKLEKKQDFQHLQISPIYLLTTKGKTVTLQCINPADTTWTEGWGSTSWIIFSVACLPKLCLQSNVRKDQTNPNQGTFYPVSDQTAWKVWWKAKKDSGIRTWKTGKNLNKVCALVDSIATVLFPGLAHRTLVI